MLTARKAIIFFSLLSVVSVSVSIYNLLQPPDSGGLGRDSYGTRAHGYRALYETLDKLGVSVQRALVPPPGPLQKTQSLVLINPQAKLVQQEPEYIGQAREWVEAGGHLVLALKPQDDNIWNSELSLSDSGTSVLTELGLPDVRLVEIWVNSDSVTTGTESSSTEEARRRERVGPVQIAEERDTADVSVLHNSSGLADVKKLHLPYQDLQVLDFLTTAPGLAEALVKVMSEDDQQYTLAAVFPKGKGSITVLSDSALLENYVLQRLDNSVLAVNLMARAGNSVVFDEFYHGLNVRGNPLWLLTQRGYAWLLALILLAVALWIWRQSVAAGPPLPAKEIGRRNLGEYLDAMAAMFMRARHRKYVLQELFAGVLWHLRDKLHLPPGSENVNSICQVLERQSPEKAVQLRKAFETVSEVLNDKRALHHAAFTEVAQEINKCL